VGGPDSSLRIAAHRELLISDDLSSRDFGTGHTEPVSTYQQDEKHIENISGPHNFSSNQAKE
jgi:hypothetical protein